MTGQRLTALGTVCTLAGLVMVAWFGVALVRMSTYQVHRGAELDREMLSHPAEPRVFPAPREGVLLGSLSIPRVGVSSVIVEGAGEHDLEFSVGHIPGTALPGQKGNVALAGHRDTFFRGLQGICKRDDILVTTPEGNRLYEVDSTRIVSPEDVYVLDDVGRPVLTLVTCYPFNYIGAAPKRFIVQAHLVGG